MRFISFLLAISLTACQLVPESGPAPTQATASTTTTTASVVYYVSPAGNDRNTGLSPTTAFQTIGKVNGLTLHAGDQVRFEAGARFTGNLVLKGNSTLSAQNPVLVSTYQPSSTATTATQATLVVATQGRGILATDFPGLILEHLRVTTSPNMGSTGVEITVSKSATVAIANTVLRDLDVSGFSGIGIALTAAAGKGLTNVRVENSQAHENGNAGIFTYANQWPQMPHSNITLTQCKAYGNPGTGKDDQHSGSGIIISGVVGALVDQCEAYGNGANNGHNGGGPMGIWCYDARGVVIQNSESHHNLTSRDADGGGFDIDGGSSDCVIQYCYSHDNQGEGYGLFEYGSPNPWVNNTLRFNISSNDGLKLNAGALSCWAAGGYSLRQSYVYNNTFVGSVGVSLLNNNAENLLVQNNIIQAPTPYQAASTQNYVLVNNYTDPVTFAQGFRLAAASATLATQGQSLSGGVDMGPVDYYATVLNGVYPVGASKASVRAPLPVKLTSFAVQRVGTQLVVSWATASEVGAESFTVETSLTGTGFVAAGTLPAKGAGSYRLSLAATGATTYLRLKMRDTDGTTTYSGVLVR